MQPIIKQRKTYIELIILISFVAALGVATYQRNLIWRDEFRLWSDVVGKSPDKARPHNNLGLAHLRNKAHGQAIRQFLKALDLKPTFVEAHYNLGIAYQGIGLYNRAVLAYQKVLAAHQCLPGDETRLRFYLGELHNNLGVCYFTIGRVNQALSEFQEAIKIRPDHANARYNLEIASKIIKNAKRPTLIK